MNFKKKLREVKAILGLSQGTMFFDEDRERVALRIFGVLGIKKPKKKKSGSK